jgi:hypothetical protein
MRSADRGTIFAGCPTRPDTQQKWSRVAWAAGRPDADRVQHVPRYVVRVGSPQQCHMRRSPSPLVDCELLNVPQLHYYAIVVTHHHHVIPSCNDHSIHRGVYSCSSTLRRLTHARMTMRVRLISPRGFRRPPACVRRRAMAAALARAAAAAPPARRGLGVSQCVR